MKTLVIKERGQGTAEYALLLAIIALVMIAMLSLVHDRSIQAFITKVLTLSDSSAAEHPQPDTPNQITHKIITIIDFAVPVVFTIVIFYALMHLSGSNDKGRGKAKKKERSRRGR